MAAEQDQAISLRRTVEVTAADSAERWGNAGLDVLSTPAILGTVEQLCDAAMRPHVEPGQMTVGVSATMHHRAPVRVGRTVEYRVRAERFDRRLAFEFEVVDADGAAVCDGRHERAVIDVDKFKRRLG